jgi:hypothetical protein
VNEQQTDPNTAWYEARNLLQQTLRRESTMIESFVQYADGRDTGASADAAANGAISAQTSSFEGWIDEQAKKRGAKGSVPTAPWADAAEAKQIPIRVGEFGPLTYQNDDVLRARLGKEAYAKIKLLNSDATQLLNVRDQSELYAYEIVNFVDGKRTVGEIRDAVSAEYGTLPVNLVSNYLQACVQAGVLQWK